MTEPLDDGRPLMTSGEVAARFRVRTRTVATWAREGRLPTAATTPGGHRRFRQSDVEEFFRAIQSGERREAS